LSLIKTLADQAALNFTGRVNFLDHSTGEYLGKVSLLEGRLVFAKYKQGIGKPALFHCLIDDMEKADISFVVEPEIVSLSESIFVLSYDDFLDVGQKIYQAYRSSKKFKPPGHLRLIVNPDFIPRGEELSYSEFEILTVISDFNKVSDIYNESPLLEFQTINSLVSLRKKGALKVVDIK
jgi:hypothetical protein